MQNNQTCGPVRIDEEGNTYRLRPEGGRYGQCAECKHIEECKKESKIEWIDEEDY